MMASFMLRESVILLSNRNIDALDTRSDLLNQVKSLKKKKIIRFEFDNQQTFFGKGSK